MYISLIALYHYYVDNMCYCCLKFYRFPHNHKQNGMNDNYSENNSVHMHKRPCQDNKNSANDHGPMKILKTEECGIELRCLPSPC